jgi:hypothetical protein
MTYQEWADKLGAIASYLQSLFPECQIEKIEDALRCQLFRKHIFRIEDRVMKSNIFSVLTMTTYIMTHRMRSLFCLKSEI